MFDFPDGKLFMDAVHGYIRVPKCFVTHLIDTEMFQRLRNIDQTGMRILYPNAKHDRFSHSLGVFHLGCAAVDTLLENFSHDEYWKISSDHTSLTFWAKNKVLFLIACLLHDIGHAPFSHALENIILENSSSVNSDGQVERLPNRLIKELARLEGQAEEIALPNAAAHEFIGALYIVTHMRGAIEAVFDDLIAQNYPSVNSENILYAEHYQYNPCITKDSLDSDIAFIARMILGLKYTGYQPEKQIRNCFIELLNGGNFDVDKLDYVIRDTRMSGISNINIDIARLLGALCIVSKTRYINTSYQGDKLNGRGILRLFNSQGDHIFHLRGEFRGTLLLKKGAEATIHKDSTFLSLLPLDHGKLRYAEGAEAGWFDTDTALFQDGREITRTSGTAPNLHKTLDLKNGDPFDFRIKNAKVLSDNFHFTACSDSSGGDAAELRVNGYCDIEVKGSFSTKSTMKAFQVELDGQLHEMILLGDMINRQVPNENVYNEFSVGFKKQAINVIANVLEARDYLYLWVYAHHKVMYYANFLLPIVSKEILGQTGSGAFPMWPLNFEHLEMLDDAYIWTAVKYYRATPSGKNPELFQLCEDLLSRRYRLSLYKSMAEFDLLFEAIPANKRLDIKKYLIEQHHTPWLDNRGTQVGYLHEDFLKTLKGQAEGLDGIVDLVYVDAGYKLKRLKVEETFIVTSDQAVASLDEIPLLAGLAAPSTDTSYYFYLYYRTNTTEPKAREAEACCLRNAIQDFFVERLNGGTPHTRDSA